ncbi:MAG: hypothetical protein H7A51_13135 [Akkermansiaceae bacterium]|nr:hypothetical protein [Akkermansiaceae bacterium]
MILDSIDRALEAIYARRRRLAVFLCLLLVGSAAITLSIYPDLLSSMLKVSKQTQSDESKADKAKKKKKVTEKKRRPMPKELKDQVVKKKKDQLRKRMLREIERMKRQVAEMERMERERMEELNKLRDPKQDMIDRINEIARIVKEKAHTFNNKDDRKEVDDLDREASELAREIEEELKKTAEEKSPKDPGGKPANEDKLKELANKADDISKRLDEASKNAAEGEPKEDSEQASAAAKDVADDLKKLAENDLREMTEGLADSETNPMRSEPRPLSELTVKELHDLAQDLAAQANDLYADIKAAEKAKKDDLSFNDSLASQKNPDYQKNKLDGKTPSTPKSPDSKNSAENPEGESLDDFANFTKDAMKGIQQAARSINRHQRLTDPNMRAAALAAAMGSGQGGQGRGQGTGLSKRGEGYGNKIKSGPDDPLRLESGGTFDQTGMKWKEALAASKYHFSHDQLRQILPARRFSKESLRKGWFYIDSWYLIGPWKAPWADGRVDYRVSFPPEREIDLEANYGIGQDGKPLTWKFKQFDSVLMAMDPQWRDSAYFLYTELYFEEDTDMVLAIAADDTAKVWVNDQVAIEEDTMSDWALNESFKKVRFHRGFNKILVRQQNGPGESDLSVIICAEEIITK